MIELHWSVLAAIMMVSAIFGFAVFAILSVASYADDKLEEMRKL